MRTIVKSQKSKAERPFSRAISRSIFVFILYSLSAAVFTPIKAQEAFYIYRNDGDFNGFFYDEVIEMRQSKIGVDSIEYDRWVTQEVVLADTIYRIPLAAIDSIGFQQPEIKFNPRVKFMEQEGLCPYVDYASEFGVTFVNLPAHLKPQIGDVLIGLPTDEIAQEKYDEGSFSCIVDDLYTDGDVTYVSGHAIEQLSDVFEQYITVEQIGVTKDGQVVRRIAGCTPEGFPRAKIKQVSGDSELKLIDFESTFTRSWNPTDNSAIELSAQIGLVVKFRAAFNVTWTRFMASLSQDMVIKTKPALAMSVSQGFDFDSGELLPCDEILFPAACPIFGINPIPSLFLRGEGKLEAKLNMPQVRLGVGQHYTIDSDSWFPVSLGLHLVPDENKEVPADMLDLSGQVAFSGYVQTGMKFSGDIFTASWIKKIFRFALGTYLYAGPKIGGEFKNSVDLLPGDTTDMSGTPLLYDVLSQSQLNIALLSLDLEAKGHFSVFSKEGEKKFFDKNWSFLTDTISYTPQIKSMDAIVSEDSTSVRLRLNVGQGHTLGYCWAEIGIFKPGQDEPIKKIGMFDLSRVTEEQAREGFSVVCPYDDLKAQTYFAVPIVHIGGAGEFVLDEFRTGFVPPFKLEILGGSSLTFGAKDGLTQIVSIKTNALKESILIDPGNALWIDINWKEDYEYITVVDEKEGRYDIAIKAYKNLSLFDRTETGKRAPSILLMGELESKMFPIDVYQAAPDLSSVRVDGGGWFHAGDSSSHGAYYYGDVTASRSDNTVTIDGTYTENYDNGYKSAQTHTIHLLIERTNENGDPNEGNFWSCKRICSGWVKEHEVYSDYNSNGSQWKTTMVIDSELHFSDSKGWQPEGAEEEYVSGKATSGQYDCEHYSTSSSDKHDTMASGAESYVVFHITIK